MTAITIHASAAGLAISAVLYLAYTLWENWRHDKRRGEYWHRHYMEEWQRNYNDIHRRAYMESVVAAAEAWADDPDPGWTGRESESELRTAVDAYREAITLPPPSAPAASTH